MQRFHFLRNSTLPRLAWCARLVPSSPTVEVEHGDWVETRDDRFVEGAWTGPFSDGRLDAADNVLGSGASVRDGAVWFTPTTHTMERLYSMRLGEVLFVANSLPYLLQATGSALDLGNWTYERDLMTFLRGYKQAVKRLRLARGRSAMLHYHQTFRVDDRLNAEAVEPPLLPRFDSYAAYVGYLSSTVARLQGNANAPERQIKFAPLATVSSGYDSPACAVLAREIGCSQAVTFTDARTQFAARMSTSDDSGEEIGNLLGLAVEKFSRAAYLEADGFPEAPFLATGSGGDDVVMSALGARLERTLFFTGMLGDTLWGVPPGQDPALSEEFRFRFPAGGSLQEFRLATGFVHVPIPLLTFKQHADVARISAAEEMRPWRVDGKYDRPIPRRLVEEQGVPRGAFAQEKRAITEPFWLKRAKAASMSARSLADFHEFRERVAARYPLGGAQLRAIEAGRRALYRVRRKYAEHRRDPYYTPAYLAAAVAEPLRFHWAVEKTAAAYRGTALRPAKRG